MPTPSCLRTIGIVYLSALSITSAVARPRSTDPIEQSDQARHGQPPRSAFRGCNGHTSASINLERRGRPIPTFPCDDIASRLNAIPQMRWGSTRLDVQKAFDCQNSVPFIDTIIDGTFESLQNQVAMEATLPYISDANLANDNDFDPVTSSYSALLDSLRQRAHAGAYSSQLSFEQDISAVFRKARDVNFMWSGSVDTLFQYCRSDDLRLVCIERDDGSLEIELYGDLDNEVGRVVQYLNGVPIFDFLKSEADSLPFRDPQARWNALFAYTHDPGLFLSPNSFPGQWTNLTFTDGSSVERANYAVVTRYNPWSDVEGGFSAYDAFVKKDPPNEPQDFEGIHPLQKLGRTYVSANFITVGGQGPDRVAILNLGSLGEEEPDEYVNFLTNFFQRARMEWTPRVIIDLRGTWRGSYEHAKYTLYQFFPEIFPLQVHRIRKTDATQALGTALSSDPYLRDTMAAFFQYQTYRWLTVDPIDHGFDENPFQSWADLSTPAPQSEDDSRGGFSKPFAIYNADLETWVSEGEGTAQFQPQNFVLLSDGTCSGPCSIFVEDVFNKVPEAKTIFVGGGYPDAALGQRTPMVGGARGAREISLADLHHLSAETIKILEEQVPDGTNPEDDPGVKAAVEILPAEPPIQMGRGSINLLNHYRTSDQRVPYQFLPQKYYAQCVMRYDRSILDDTESLYTKVWEVAFGGENYDWDWSLCLEGSTDDSIDWRRT